VDKIEKTVVATNIPTSVDERGVFQHFCRCGTILDVKVVRNRLDNTVGTAIIEFLEDEGVTRACALPPPHNELHGQVVLVKRADAQLTRTGQQPRRQMTRQQFTQQVLTNLKAGPGGGDAGSGPSMRKLHIKNLRPVVTEEDMRGIFKPFGDFDDFEMGSGECWITFANHGDAQDAMTSMQGFQLVGQELQIAVQPVAPPAAPAPAPSMAPPPPERLNLMIDTDFGATGAPRTDPLANRIELMRKLMSSHSEQGVPTVVGLRPPSANSAGPAAPATNPELASMPPAPKPGGPTSRTLLLQNMFTPSAVDLAKDPRFYEEMREDTHDECAKFGKVLHVTVDPRGSSGLIYVLFESPQQRLAAEMQLNGRWFEGKKIVAMGIDDDLWQMLAAQSQSG